MLRYSVVKVFKVEMKRKISEGVGWQGGHITATI